MLAILLSVSESLADLASTTVFVHGERDECTCIRGPMLLRANDTLVAFANCIPSVGDNCQPFHPKPAPAGSKPKLVYKRSTNGGLDWGALSDAPGSGAIVSLKSKPGVLVIYSTDGPWQSENGGLNWTRRAADLASAPAGGPLIQLSADHKVAPNRLLGAFRQGPTVWDKAAQSFFSDGT